MSRTNTYEIERLPILVSIKSRKNHEQPVNNTIRSSRDWEADSSGFWYT